MLQNFIRTSQHSIRTSQNFIRTSQHSIRTSQNRLHTYVTKFCIRHSTSQPSYVCLRTSYVRPNIPYVRLRTVFIRTYQPLDVRFYLYTIYICTCLILKQMACHTSAIKSIYSPTRRKAWVVSRGV